MSPSADSIRGVTIPQLDYAASTLQEIFPSLFWLRSPGRAPATPFTYVLRRPAGAAASRTRVNRDMMARTVRLLATVQFDVILSNSFAAAPIAWLEVTPQSRARIFAEVLGRLTS